MVAVTFSLVLLELLQCVSALLFTGHTSAVSALYVADNHLFSGSFDETLKQWDLKTGLCLRTFIGHRGFITNILIHGGLMYTTSGDSDIREWNITNSSTIRVIRGHSSAVWGLIIENDMMTTSSWDSTIRKWDLITGMPIGVPLILTNPAWDLAANSQYYIAALSDGAIEQWDRVTLTRIRIMYHQKRVRRVTAMGNFVLSASEDGRFIQWDLTDGSMVRVFDPNVTNYIGEAILPFQNLLITAGSDGILRRWNLTSGALVSRHSDHATGQHWAMAIGNGVIYTGGTANTIFSWNCSLLSCNLPARTSTSITSTTTSTTRTTSTSTTRTTTSTTRKTSTSITRTTTSTTRTTSTSITSTTCSSSMTLLSFTTELIAADSSSMTSMASLSAASELITPASTLTFAADQALSLPILSVTNSDPLSNMISLLVEVKDVNGKPSTGNAVFVIIIVAISVTLCFLAIIISYCAFCKMRDRNTSLKKFTESSEIILQPGTTMTDTSRTMNQTTIVGTKYELALPAFLELTWGYDFRQEKFLAKGGGGSLYEASSTSEELSERSNDMPLVVKRLAGATEQLSSKQINAFKQEVSIMYRFRDHRNFAKLCGYSLRPVCLIMKRYHWGDLNAYIEAQSKAARLFPYSKLRVLRLFTDVCKAIEHMHESGFAHCDIKPGNVLLDSEGRDLMAVLTDFGICQVISAAAVKVYAFEVANINGASVYFAAPEALMRLRTKNNVYCTPRIWKSCDVYSLGATLCKMMKRSKLWSQ